VYFIAAASYQPPYLPALPRRSLWRQKERRPSFFENHRTKRREKFSASSGFFFVATAGRLKQR